MLKVFVAIVAVRNKTMNKTIFLAIGIIAAIGTIGITTLGTNQVFAQARNDCHLTHHDGDDNGKGNSCNDANGDLHSGGKA